MTSIRAVVVDPQAGGCLAVKEVQEPTPGASDVLVRVQAVSLNPGEVRRAQGAPAGSRIGGDFAGTVEAPAADGSGPGADTRVVGLARPRADGWAERIAVPVASLAVLPDGVPFEQAAALPVAGLTALYALRKGGTLVGQRVLITGASGGVGHLAVQLASQAGATAVGLVRREAHVKLVEEAGAREVVVDETGAGAAAHGPYDLVLDSVGGAVLAGALSALAQGGTCVLFGASADGSVTFDSRKFFLTGRTSLYGFYLWTELGAQPAGGGLAVLASLVAEGRLRPLIEVDASWTRVGEIAQQLLDRRYVGKAVLRVD